MTLPRSAILCLSLAAAAGWGFASPALAQESAPTSPPTSPAGVAFTITLQSGEILKGALKASDKDSVLITHALLGDVRLPRVQITASEPALPPPPPPPPLVVEVSSTDLDKAAAAAALAARASPPALKPAAPAVPEKISLWTGITRDDEKELLNGWTRSVEFGMNTSSGNSDTFNFRNSVSLRRATKKMSTSVDTSYNYARNNSGEVSNRGEVRARNDFNLGDSNWQLWGAGAIEVDKRAPWEARLSLSTGPAYTFIKDEKTTLVSRVGVGGYREIDGGNNDVVSNAVAAVDLSQRLAERATMYANTEFYPDLANTDHLRAVSRAGVTYVIDPESRTTLKLGAEHRYNSHAGPRDNSDVDLFVTLGFTF